MNATKARITIDFPQEERDALQMLCEADFRLPSDQIRWLVIEAAKQRGLMRVSQQTQNGAGGHIRQDLVTSTVP